MSSYKLDFPSKPRNYLFSPFPCIAKASYIEEEGTGFPLIQKLLSSPAVALAAVSQLEGRDISLCFCIIFFPATGNVQPCKC